jgi:hypothetical protein
MGAHVLVVGDEDAPAIDPSRPVVYDLVFDEYQLATAAWPLGSVVLTYCPWCGVALPDSKRNRWYDALDAAGIEPDDPALDARYRSDAWWAPGTKPRPADDREDGQC